MGISGWQGKLSGGAPSDIRRVDLARKGRVFVSNVAHRVSERERFAIRMKRVVPCPYG